MNFYLTGTESVINQNKPTGKVLFDIVVTCDLLLGNWPDPTSISIGDLHMPPCFILAIFRKIWINCTKTKDVGPENGSGIFTI